MKLSPFSDLWQHLCDPFKTKLEKLFFYQVSYTESSDKTNKILKLIFFSSPQNFCEFMN